MARNIQYNDIVYISKQPMRKFFLSSSVIVLFALYVLFPRPRAEDTHAIIPSLANENKKQSRPVAGIPATITPPNILAPTQVPVQAPKPKPAPTPARVIAKNKPLFKDGEYVGNVADAYYGYIQVKAVIENGKITDVQFLEYPNDRRTSIAINTEAMPLLKMEAIRAQNAQVNIISGATDSSIAFRESLAYALTQAKNQT